MNQPVIQQEDVREICQALLTRLVAILDQKLVGVYLYGALTFPETLPAGDIDFHVILSKPLNEAEKSQLQEMFDAFARDYPPLGGELDGYFILLDEARGSIHPTHQMRPDIKDTSWALHRAHILAGRYIALHGPDPRQIYTPPTWLELERDLGGELLYVSENLGKYPAYCVLNLCRLMYSFSTQDVVISKARAAAWAMETFPQWHPHIQYALKSYAKTATAEEEEFMRAEVHELYRFAGEKIQSFTRWS